MACVPHLTGLQICRKRKRYTLSVCVAGVGIPGCVCTSTISHDQCLQQCLAHHAAHQLCLDRVPDHDTEAHWRVCNWHYLAQAKPSAAEKNVWHGQRFMNAHSLKQKTLHSSVVASGSHAGEGARIKGCVDVSVVLVGSAAAEGNNHTWPGVLAESSPAASQFDFEVIKAMHLAITTPQAGRLPFCIDIIQASANTDANAIRKPANHVETSC